MPALPPRSWTRAQSFNETNADRRRAAIREIYAEDAGYTDPHVALRGLEQIDLDKSPEDEERMQQGDTKTRR